MVGYLGNYATPVLLHILKYYYGDNFKIIALIGIWRTT
jgi:hypothetical protein